MGKIGLNNVRIYGKPIVYKMPIDSIEGDDTGITLTLNTGDMFSSYYGFLNKEEKKEKLPKRYIINKGATILFWNDDETDKTIVKRCKEDEFNKRLGFLTAYFQYHSGLSKTQANKYLSELEVDD